MTWEAGARSVAVLSGDGFFSFRAPVGTLGAVVGFNDANSGTEPYEIKHGFHIRTGTYRIIESGAYKTAFVPFVNNDKFTILRHGNTVYYYVGSGDLLTNSPGNDYKVGGTLVYTSNIPSNYPVFLDASLLMWGDKITDLQFYDYVSLVGGGKLPINFSPMQVMGMETAVAFSNISFEPLSVSAGAEAGPQGADLVMANPEARGGDHFYGEGLISFSPMIANARTEVITDTIEGAAVSFWPMAVYAEARAPFTGGVMYLEEMHAQGLESEAQAGAYVWSHPLMLTAAGEHGLNGIKFSFAAPEPISVARGFPFVIVEHEERYDGRVIVEYEESSRYGVLREVSSSYRYLQEIVVDVNHLYDIKVTDSAVADLYVTSTHYTTSDIDSSYIYAEPVVVDATHYLTSTLNIAVAEVEENSRHTVTSDVPSDYAYTSIVIADETSSYAVKSTVSAVAEVETVSHMYVSIENYIQSESTTTVILEHDDEYVYTSSVIVDVSSSYALREYNMAVAEVSDYYSLLSPYLSPTDVSVVVLVDGVSVDFESVDITTDEPDPYYVATVVLTEPEEFRKFVQDNEFTVMFFGEEYKFVVDSKQSSRAGPAEIVMTVKGVSPLAMYDEPRSSLVTHTWDESVIVSDAIDYLLPDLSYVWDFVDWQIPAYRLGFDGVSPLSGARAIIEAAGGVLESLPNGSAIVRHLYPVSTNRYGTTTPVHIFTEQDDVFTQSEEFVSGKIVDRIRISDIEANYADKMEWEADEGTELSGKLKAFPSPWRDYPEAAVSHTAPSGVLVWFERIGTSYTEEIIQGDEDIGELIEIVAGEGNTRFPVHSIVSAYWESLPLPTIAYETDTSTIRCGGPDSYGLLRLTYTTRYHEYKVAGVDGKNAQFLMEDNSGE